MKKDPSKIKDVALMHEEIIKKISQYQNGIAAEKMSGMGLKYAVNYGLSIPQVDLIAKAIIKDNDFAVFLWKQKERESKLLALRILKNFDLTHDQTIEFINGITNIEIAEQAVIHLFSKLDNRYELASELIKKDQFIQLSGFLLISRLAMIDKNSDDSIFAQLLSELFTNQPKDNAIFMYRGFAQALLKTGLRSEELKNKVKQKIKTINKTSPGLASYLNQEVNYYLIENN